MQDRPNFLGLSVAGVFYRSRDDWMRAVTAEPELSMNAKAVACYLAVRVNKNSRDAFPQQTTMAKELGVSRATVMRAVAELIDQQWLEKEQGRRGKHKAVNRYSLILPWAKVAP